MGQKDVWMRIAGCGVCSPGFSRNFSPPFSRRTCSPRFWLKLLRLGWQLYFHPLELLQNQGGSATATPTSRLKAELRTSGEIRLI